MSCNVVVARAAERQIANYDLPEAIRLALYDFLANELPKRDPTDFAQVYPRLNLVGCGFQTTDPDSPSEKHAFCFHLIPGDDGKTFVLADTGHAVTKVLSGPHNRLLPVPPGSESQA